MNACSLLYYPICTIIYVSSFVCKAFHLTLFLYSVLTNGITVKYTSRAIFAAFNQRYILKLGLKIGKV